MQLRSRLRAATIYIKSAKQNPKDTIYNLYCGGQITLSAASTLWCFCKANWRKLKAAFRSRYEAELVAAIKRKELRYPNRSDDAGDDAGVAA